MQVGREFKLDLIHAHYAIPHATAALLAKQVLESGGHSPVARVVTTLHGTDITLVGSDRSVPGDRGILDRALRWRDRCVSKPRGLPRTRSCALRVRSR